MGGTTAKICLIDDYQPQASRTFEVARVGRFKKGSGLPLRIPVIEMVEIGAGGGSLAARGRARAASRSGRRAPAPIRARPATAAAAREPAVTDANLLLGRYDPARFAGGTHDAATPAAARGGAGSARSAASSGSTPGMAALGVVEMVDENMANAARVHAIESGKTYAGRTLIAFGGGGPGAWLPGRREGRHRPRAGADRRRRRQRDRLPARAGRLRGGAQPLSAARHASTWRR